MTRSFALAVLALGALGAGSARGDEAAPVPAGAPETPVPAAPAGTEAPPETSPAAPPMLPMILILGAVMYFLVIRPQRKEEKARKEMLSQLKKHDHVLTSSGIYGVVANVTDDEVVLKVDESKDVRMKFSRSAIAKVIAADGSPASPAASASKK